MQKISIRLKIFTHFILLILFSSLSLLGVQYFFNSKYATMASEKHFQELFDRVEYRNKNLNQQNQMIVSLLQQHPNLKGEIKSAKLLPLFSETLAQFPQAYAIELATTEDDFFLVLNMEHSKNLSAQLKAPASTAWTVMQVDSERQTDNFSFQYFNSQLQLLSETVSTSEYKASQRPWFQKTIQSDDIYHSPPHLFWHLNAPGIKFAKKVNNDRVLVIDYTIEYLTTLLEELKPTENSQIILFNRLGEKYFETDVTPRSIPLNFQGFQLSQQERDYITNLPILKVSNQSNWEPFDFTQNGYANGFSVELLKSIAQQIGLKIQFINDYSWEGMLEEFKQGRIDILHALLRSAERDKIGIFSDPYYSVDNFLITHTSIPKIETAKQLLDLRFALGRGWQSTELLLEKFPHLNYQLYDDLPSMMRAVDAGQADVFIDNTETFSRNRQKLQLTNMKVNQDLKVFIPHLEHLHFLAQPEYAPLVDILNRALNTIDQDSFKELEHAWYLGNALKTLKISPYETLFYKLLNQLPADDKAQFDKLDVDGKQYFTAVSSMKYNNETAYLATLVPSSSLLAPYYQQLYLSLLAIAVSLIIIFGLAHYSSGLIVRPIHELMKRNQFIANRDFKAVTPLETHIKELSELSDTLITVSESFQQYEKNQENFLDGLVKLIAEAIDKRSHHTYSHCSRVPKLGIMILEAGLQQQEGRFKNFTMSTHEKKAFEIGAWLHDAGKMTTPDSILEKSTKLDTFYNRIHEIRMRFEVLWRDAEIRYYQKIHDHPTDSALHAKFQDQLQQTHQRLQEEFEFIARLNVGLEAVTADALAKLDGIAQNTWQNHFDKRLGLSKSQQAKMPKQTSNTETLLQDFPEHISMRNPQDYDYFSQQHFVIKVPEHEFNLGEKYNLSIERGTLSAEERFKMEEHVMMTLKLLEQVPLPRHYQNIPKYAGTHHEKLDGSGYPRQLTAEQLGMPERIMVMADIFEALTAPDRPYKRTHSLSKALDILNTMVEKNKLDRDVFELFLRSGVYQSYAEEYIDPSQIDEVDIQKYLRIAPTIRPPSSSLLGE